MSNETPKLRLFEEINLPDINGNHDVYLADDVDPLMARLRKALIDATDEIQEKYEASRPPERNRIKGELNHYRQILAETEGYDEQ